MYNPATQVQVPRDADLGSYYLKKNRCRGFHYRIPLKKVANLGLRGTYDDRLTSSYLNFESGLLDKDCLFTFIIFH